MMMNRPNCAPDEPMLRMPLFQQKPCGCQPPRPPRPSCPPTPPCCQPSSPCCQPNPPCLSLGVPAAPPVCVVNPFNPCERATVLLSIDECGNLIVRIRR